MISSNNNVNMQTGRLNRRCNVLIMLLHAFLSWQRPAVSIQLAFFTTRKQYLGFLAELRVDQTPDVAI